MTSEFIPLLCGASSRMSFFIGLEGGSMDERIACNAAPGRGRALRAERVALGGAVLGGRARSTVCISGQSNFVAVAAGSAIAGPPGDRGARSGFLSGLALALVAASVEAKLLSDSSWAECIALIARGGGSVAPADLPFPITPALSASSLDGLNSSCTMANAGRELAASQLEARTPWVVEFFI